jgi:hypothetical protein
MAGDRGCDEQCHETCCSSNPVTLSRPVSHQNYTGTTLSYTQAVGLLGWGISPPQNRYLHIGQHKPTRNAHNTDIHAFSGIRTHDPSLRTGEDISCLRQRDNCN